MLENFIFERMIQNLTDKPKLKNSRLKNILTMTRGSIVRQDNPTNMTNIY